MTRLLSLEFLTAAKRVEHDKNLQTTYPNPAISPRGAPPPPPSPGYLYKEITDSEDYIPLKNSKSCILPSTSKSTKLNTSASFQNVSRFTEIFTPTPEFQYNKNNAYKYPNLPGRHRNSVSGRPTTPIDPNPPLNPAARNGVDNPPPWLDRTFRQTVKTWQTDVAASKRSQDEQKYEFQNPSELDKA